MKQKLDNKIKYAVIRDWHYYELYYLKTYAKALRLEQWFYRNYICFTVLQNHSSHLNRNIKIFYLNMYNSLIRFVFFRDEERW